MITPLVLSGRSVADLRARAGRVAALMDERHELDLTAVARGLLDLDPTGAHRAVALGDERDAVREGLAAFAAAVPTTAVVAGTARTGADPGPVLVFSGHGSQWAGMATALLDESAVMREALARCEDALAPHVGFSVGEVLRGAPGAPALDRVDVVQPLLFAITVALAAVWRAYGVRPSAVVGHSQGEIAAAHVAGALSLQDAARVVALRARALAALSGRGAMVAISLPAAAVEARLARFGDALVVAALNGPEMVAVSGVPEAVEALRAECEAEGIRARRVRIDYAAHSPQVDAIRDELLKALAPIAPRAAEVPLYSTVTGARLDTTRMDAEHWFTGERRPVQLDAAVRRLLEDGHRTFLEVGPHPVLTAGIQQTVDATAADPRSVVVASTLRRDQGGSARFATALAELHVRGTDVDWTPLTGDGPPVALTLPEAPTTAPETPFAERARALGDAARGRLVLDLVLAEVAAVLGEPSPRALDPGRAFKELGFDSAAAIEVRNRLVAATGLALDTTVLFDQPTPQALAQAVVAEIMGEPDHAAGARRARPRQEPIAIVGIGCRFPGDVRSADDLWDLVIEGRDAIGPFPTDRGWDLQHLHDPTGERPGSTYVQHGGFLYDAADFDAEHFSISRREALSMDPHQRLMLECSWEALEDAGLDPLSLRGSETGVFTGIYGLDYGPRMHDAAPATAGYALTGTLPSVVAGRVAYTFGLEGPAVSVDTACSSSLVALHLACQALHAGECDLALAGGATVMASPGIFVDFARQRGLSPDGRCRAYGDGADGTGFAEGTGVLVLAPLSVARERGLDVLAVVRATATNQDGASNGLTAPSGTAQARMIRQALAQADLAPGDVDAVEGHGTGTALGDPIEAGALLATYGRERAGAPLYLGSLKSNIGHTQAAAGVGGVIKMVQALRHGTLPPTLHADTPSPHVDWASGNIALLTEPTAWPERDGPRRAGVSSFGISGTNAHVILEQAPADAAADAPAPALPVVPFLVSGTSDAALQAQLGRLRDAVAAPGAPDLPATARALARGRAHLSHRAVVLAADRDQLVERLDAGERGAAVPGVVRGTVRRAPRVGFLFPGQGGQWEGMAVALLDESPLFRARMEACAAALAPHVSFDLLGVLRGEPGQPSLEPIEVVQPVLFAIMVSLAALWRAAGVEPVAVIGHSQGEIAAAHVAGGLSLEDAARIVAVRSQELAHIEGGGGMMAVSLPQADFEARAAAFDGRVTIAAVNGPAALVASGDPEALDALQAGLEADGIRHRRIASTVAGHSPHVEVARTAMLERLAGVAPGPGTVPLYSTVTTEVEPIEGLGAEHWYRNLRQTVLFAPALRKLADAGVDTLIEIGPHPVLSTPALEVLEAAGDAAVLSTMRRGEGGLERFVTALGEAHAHGVAIDWAWLLPGTGRVPLPTYAFQRRRYWLDAGERGQDVTTVGQAAAGHPLLGARVALADGGVLFTGRLALEAHPWLAEQAEDGAVVFPASGFLELALHAGAEVGCGVVADLDVAAPLVVAQGTPVVLQVSVGAAAGDGTRRVDVHARRQDAADDAAWTTHATGHLAPEAAVAPGPPPAWPDGAVEAEADPLIGALRRVGHADGAVHVEAALADADPGDFTLHPALLDAALRGAAGEDRVPVAFGGVRLHAGGATSVHLAARPGGDEAADVVLADADGTIATLDRVRFGPAPAAVAATGGGDPLLRVRWVAATPAPGAAPTDDELDLTAVRGEDPAAIRAAVADALDALQRWLIDPGGGRLTVLTRGAIAVGADARPDVAARAVWGLLRTARTEHPDRFALVDLDDAPASRAAVPAAVALGEPQAAVRDGQAFVARLERVADRPADPEPWPGTVLVTGGTSGLGAAVARHLAARHGVRHLLLASRRGPAAPGADALADELRALGAAVTIAACDVADRDAVRGLLDAVPEAHPLTGVVHCAMVLEDATIGSMTRAQVDAVLTTKLDAALHLDELTRGADLRAFVLCSSVTSELGSPGQGNYVAANAGLNALAERRHADGLPAVAIAYGLLGETRAADGTLRGDDAARVLRRLSGSDALRPLTHAQALDALDRGLVAGIPAFVASPFDRRTLAGELAAGSAPALLTALLPVRPRRAAPAPGAAAPSDGADAGPAVDLPAAMRAEIAAALGYASADALDPSVSFLELGVDSLLALELRNRLQALTGETLSTTLVYEHRSPADLIAHLAPAPDDAPPPVTTAGGNGAAGEPLTALLRRAQGLGRPRDGLAAAEATARLRPRFGLSHAEYEVPPLHVLARGDAAGPVVGCVPSVIATGGPHEFTRLARSFAARPEVVALEHPGFRPHAALPSTVEAAAAAEAAALRRHAGTRPVVLVGFSTGGLLAHAIAAQLARHRVAVGAIVLVDAYAVEPSIEHLLGRVVERMLTPDRAQPDVTDETLMAMATYLRALQDWRPARPVAPTLLVAGAAEAAGGPDRWWPHHDALVTVPADHLSILEDGAEATAAAIETWLGSLRVRRRRLARLAPRVRS